MKRTSLAVAALLAIGCAHGSDNVVDRSCHDEFLGTVYQEWPTHEIQILGELTNYSENHRTVSFDIAAVNHFSIRKENVIYAHFDHHSCEFAIKYKYDPIFANGFEKEDCDDDNDSE